MQTQRGFVGVGVLIAIVLGLIVVGGGAYYVSQQSPSSQVTLGNFDDAQTLPTTNTSVQTTPTQQSGWKKYSDAAIEFEYPSLVSVTKQAGQTVILNHSIGYSHPNFCSGKDEGSPLEKLTDLNVSITVYNSNLTDTVQSYGGDYEVGVVKNFSENNNLNEGGTISTFRTGSLSGFRFIRGFEGCGEYRYYLSVSSSKTILVTRNLIPELNDSANRLQYLNLPGIISPNQEEEYFAKILTSLTVK